MNHYALFAASREDVQKYRHKPTAVLHDIPDTSPNTLISNMPTGDIAFSSTSTSRGSYIDACSYGVELAWFLEGTVKKDGTKTFKFFEIEQQQSEGTVLIGVESDHVGEESRESCSIYRKVILNSAEKWPKSGCRVTLSDQSSTFCRKLFARLSAIKVTESFEKISE